MKILFDQGTPVPLLLLSTSWPRLQVRAQEIRQTIETMKPGEYKEFALE